MICSPSGLNTRLIWRWGIKTNGELEVSATGTTPGGLYSVQGWGSPGSHRLRMSDRVDASARGREGKSPSIDIYSRISPTQRRACVERSQRVFLFRYRPVSYQAQMEWLKFTIGTSAYHSTPPYGVVYKISTAFLPDGTCSRSVRMDKKGEEFLLSHNRSPMKLNMSAVSTTPKSELVKR